jgi:DNA invertase Pin-like site-specific DNA recombinase
MLPMDGLAEKAKGNDDEISLHSLPKMTPQKVAETKKLLKSGEISGAEIARRMGVSEATIHRIASGEVWGGIEPEAD